MSPPPFHLNPRRFPMFSVFVCISSPVDHRTSPSRSPSVRSCRKKSDDSPMGKGGAMQPCMAPCALPSLRCCNFYPHKSHCQRWSGQILCALHGWTVTGFVRVYPSCQESMPMTEKLWKITTPRLIDTYLNCRLEWSVGLIGGCQMMPGTPTIGHWDPSRIPCQTHLVDYNELMHRHNDPS